MKNKKLYNYIVNTFGISKEIIMEQVNSRIEDVIAKHVRSKLDSNYVENMIANKIAEVVQNGVSSSDTYWGRQRTHFDDYMKKTVRSVIEERLGEEYELEVKMVRKDRKMIGSV